LYVRFHRLLCLVVSGAVACAVFALLSVERTGFSSGPWCRAEWGSSPPASSISFITV
jgi:hypothetical protein